jgi:hypothetical protein
VPDPEAITQEFNREFAAMLAAVGAKKTPPARKAASRATPAARKRGLAVSP